MRSSPLRFIPPLALALGLLLGGCALPAPQPAADVIIRDAKNSAVVATRRAGGLVLDVRSETGIDSARVYVPAQPAVRDLILRMHLRGLEELLFTYAAGTVMVSVASSGEPLVRETFTPTGGSAQEITRGSPWWMDVGILSDDPAATPTIPLGNGHFDVSAPTDYLAGDNLDFMLSWIDFYR